MAALPFDVIFRDFDIEGEPASGEHHPRKDQIRDALNAIINGPFPDNRIIRLNNADTGTPDNVVVSASVAIPNAVYQVLYILNITQENTGPVTVSGAINRQLVTNTSRPVPVGYLTPGMAVLCIDTGSALRMLSYGDMEVLIRAAQAEVENARIERLGAEAAKDIAAGYVNDIVSEKEVPIFSTINGMSSINVDPAMTNIYLRGRTSDKDDEGGWFSTEDTGSQDSFSSGDGRTWYRVSRDRDNSFLALTNMRLLAIANNKIMAGANYSIVCVGDSLTYGYDVVSADRIPPAEGHVTTRAPIQYPPRLKARLELATTAAVNVTNRGFSGDTAKRSYERWGENPNADIAMIMLGTNDGNSGVSIAEYALYMERLIQRYIRWGCAVVILTPPSANFNVQGLAHARYGQFARALGEAYNCPVFESIEVVQYCLYTDVHSDGTHFNKHGYAKFGDAVAAFLLSGSLVRPIRGVSSEVHLTPIRGSEGIGFHTKGGVIGNAHANSYVTNGSIMGLPIPDGQIAVSFYLDAEAADLYILGTIVGCAVSLSSPVDGVAVNRGLLKHHSQRNIRETTEYTVSAQNTFTYGKRSLVGSFVGRGWKTFILHAPATGSARNVSGILIEPKSPTDVAQHGDKFRPARSEHFIYRYPNYTQTDGALPARAPIDGDICIPLPEALLGMGKTLNSFGMFGMVEVTIKAVNSLTPAAQANGITKLLLYRTGITAELQMDVIYKSAPTCIAPIAAGIGWTAFDPAMSGPVGLDKTRLPGEREQGWLYLTFSGAIAAYYGIEYRSLSPQDAEGSWMN